MTKEEIIRMARESGGLPDPMVFIGAYERFAALVAKHTLANIDPSSFMSWQEGYEAGAAAEREACAKVCEAEAEGQYDNMDIPLTIAADLIRARGQA